MTARPDSRRPAGVRTMDGLDVAGKRVLVRADLNVPTKAGRVTDRERIERLAPTLRELTEKGALVIVLSHFGRPKGRPNPEFSLRIVAPALAAALGRSEVRFAEDCVGPQAEAAVAAAKPGDVVLLENLRFHPGEEANDESFARALAKLGDAVVNDAFSAAHRAHASVDTLCRLLPSAAGRLMEAEIRALGAALESPERPVAALIGGAKVSTKLDVLGHLEGKVDRLVIGGAMANTFLAAQGVAVGKSLREAEMADQANAILKTARDAGCQVLLPVDAVVAGALQEGVSAETVAIDRVPADRMILDVGPQSVARIVAALRECRTLLWNGPLGAFEIEPFHVGTVTVASAAAELTRAGRLMSVAGGGDTVAALAKAAVLGDFSYVSTAGGAFLEWLEGRDLPGVAVLRG